MMGSALRAMGRVLTVASMLAVHARAQVVGGIVAEKKSEKPIRGVRVVLVDSNAKKIFADTMADTTGMFMLTAPSAGTFRLGFLKGSFVLGTSELFTVADTDFVQRRYVFELSNDDVYLEFQVSKPVAPKPGNRAPRYPQKMRDQRMSGRVFAQFVVDTLGRVDMETFHVLSATDPDFATAVRDALPDLRFFPAMIGDRPVRQLAIMPFQFSIAR
jgi:TonB family protein